MENVAQENEKAISGAIKIDEKEIRTHLDGLVRQSVEDTLNALLNAEADAICQASRYQRSPDRQVRSSLVGRLLRLRQLTFVICNRSETNVRKISDTTQLPPLERANQSLDHAYSALFPRWGRLLQSGNVSARPQQRADLLPRLLLPRSGRCETQTVVCRKITVTE